MFISVLLSFLLFLFIPFDVYAQVVINEVFPNPSGDSSELTEYVELYNTNNADAIDLEEYVLVDAANNSFTVSQVVIGPLEFVSFTKADTGIGLNNSEDTITLKDPLGVEVDSFSYPKTSEDKSWSRYPDGIGDFYSNTAPSKNSSNYSPPTSTPTNTPKPTKTPTPTKTPIPTRIPTATNIPTKIPTPTEKVSSAEAVSSPTSNVNELVDTNAVEKNSEQNILGIREEILKDDAEDKIYETGDQEKKLPVAAIGIILGGISFMGAGAYPYIKERLPLKDKRHEKNKKEEKINL
ncbi:lamin tail domain-containing protein [Candidatus Woesebacteria bacterium]|nr:lamin tail domain-containing protein [Candidatus Woesebacteria bacterium]